MIVTATEIRIWYGSFLHPSFPHSSSTILLNLYCYLLCIFNLSESCFEYFQLLWNLIVTCGLLDCESISSSRGQDWF